MTGHKRLAAHLIAVSLIVLFGLNQLSTLDYGTGINNVPHVAQYRVAIGDSALKALERSNLVTERSGVPETFDKWMLRFKLYSVEPDDIVSIMALSRIKPQALRFDPGFYQYGGAFLYPLGGWYAALSSVGLVRPGALSALLAEPDRMDAVYIFGRLFVLFAFLASSALLYRALLLIANPAIALLSLAIYLVCPSTIVYSQMLKPHWYALLWSNLAMLVVIDLYVRRRWGGARIVATGLGTGLAVGSAATFGLFSIGIWTALLLAWRRGLVGWRSVVVVPVVAGVTFALTNPYFLFNWQSYRGERDEMLRQWFMLTANPKFIGLFVWNSLVPALGIAFSLVAGALIAWRLVRPQAQFDRWFAVGAVVCVAAAGLITASLSAWHTNIRYVPYLLPALLIFVAAGRFRRKPVILAGVLALTLTQSVPFLLAYRDEDNPTRSTKLSAARWIDSNIPVGAGIRLGTQTPSPYEVPPFDLIRYRINASDARFAVIVEPQADRPFSVKEAVLIKRFRPRFVNPTLPFVFGFINPQVSIYRLRGGGAQ